jgi:hypothetical protein
MQKQLNSLHQKYFFSKIISICWVIFQLWSIHNKVILHPEGISIKPQSGDILVASINLPWKQALSGRHFKEACKRYRSAAPMGLQLAEHNFGYQNVVPMALSTIVFCRWFLTNSFLHHPIIILYKLYLQYLLKCVFFYNAILNRVYANIVLHKKWCILAEIEPLCVILNNPKNVSFRRLS